MQKSHNRYSRYALSDEAVPLDPEFPIFLFSYSDPHEPISSLHSHDVLELGICLRGNGIFIIGNMIHTYEAGDMIAIGPGVYHRAKSGQGMEDLWDFLYFKPNDWEAPEQSSGIGRLIKKAEDPDLYSLMKILTNEIRNRSEDCRTSISGLLKTISVHIFHLNNVGVLDDTSTLRLFRDGPDARISRAMDIMISSDSRQLSIHELAKECGMSESFFRHLFKVQVGMSPKLFQTKLKINMAMNKLRNINHRIVDISFDCGFESLSSFNRQFKKETGLSPRQWRSGLK